MEVCRGEEGKEVVPQGGEGRVEEHRGGRGLRVERCQGEEWWRLAVLLRGEELRVEEECRKVAVACKWLVFCCISQAMITVEVVPNTRTHVAFIWCGVYTLTLALFISDFLGKSTVTDMDLCCFPSLLTLFPPSSSPRIITSSKPTTVSTIKSEPYQDPALVSSTSWDHMTPSTGHVTIVVASTSHVAIVVASTSHVAIVVASTSLVTIVVASTSHVAIVVASTSHVTIVVASTSHVTIIVYSGTPLEGHP